MKILIVDDSLTMRRALVSQLAHAGYSELLEASNGMEALQQLAGVDLVIMDWNMPVMDGLTCVREIRKMPDKQSLPIIMCTTEGARDSVIEAMEQGVNDYIIKPVEQSVLVEKVGHMLEAPQEPVVGQRSFTLSMLSNQVLDKLSDRLDEEGIENRNASKLIRYSLLKLCASTNKEDLDKAVEQIRQDKDNWESA